VVPGEYTHCLACVYGPHFRICACTALFLFSAKNIHHIITYRMMKSVSDFSCFQYLCLLFFLALVGSCQYSLVSILSPLSASFIDWCGLRKISIAGGFIYSVGLISASYVNSIYGLFPTFAFIFAVSASLLYSSISIAPVKCMSAEYQGIGCAIISCGGQTGVLSFSLLIPFLLEQYDWQIMFRILAYFGVIICLLSLTYGWIEEVRDVSERRKLHCNMSLCKRPYFFLYMLGSSVSMLGWPVGNLFLVSSYILYHCTLLITTCARSMLQLEHMFVRG
jgi:MFS family permease